MIGATFCSGIGAPEIACPEIDWRLASEIERFPRAVLMHRYGVVPATQSSARDSGRYLWGDMTALRVRHMRRLGIPFPNVIVAGTPCQAFSIAGARKSLDDARGNLTLQFVRMVHAIRKATRDADGRSVLRWLLWENVPGVLSTKDNAFGCFLSGLVGADDPLCTPDGSRWPDAGMVAGPFARAAWRILDAQYFELAQRRRRVFVVVGFGDDCDPAAVLFERLGLHGNHAPGREVRQDVTGTLSARSHGGGGLGTDLELGGPSSLALPERRGDGSAGCGKRDADSYNRSWL
jgi:DNA (cytosine-5)-methyltransferase 1